MLRRPEAWEWDRCFRPCAVAYWRANLPGLRPRESGRIPAVRPALAIREAIRQLNERDPGLELQIRTAVNTGEAVVSLGARPSEGEGIASGDVVNTAARLQSAAPVDGILVGEATYRATRHV